MKSGLVFNVQRYCLHDGPGIRSTVFLKGCPLSCWWCQNPESRSPDPELVVLETRCIRCGQCSTDCPQDNARPAGQSSPEASSGACNRCGSCVDSCATGARQLVGVERQVDDVVAEVARERIFYDQSGGGVTFSGGEPLLQYRFLRALLEACRDRGIHTAVDTCGYVAREHLLEVAAWTDLFLYDLKILDERRHRRFTGVSNVQILENLESLAATHDAIWIRIPLIPGVNDEPNELGAIARFVASLERVRRIDLLPYHRTGIQKFERLGLEYGLQATAPPSRERLEELADVFRSAGLEATIGGEGLERENFQAEA